MVCTLILGCIVHNLSQVFWLLCLHTSSPLLGSAKKGQLLLCFLCLCKTYCTCQSSLRGYHGWGRHGLRPERWGLCKLATEELSVWLHLSERWDQSLTRYVRDQDFWRNVHRPNGELLQSIIKNSWHGYYHWLGFSCFTSHFRPMTSYYGDQTTVKTWKFFLSNVNVKKIKHSNFEMKWV